MVGGTGPGGGAVAETGAVQDGPSFLPPLNFPMCQNPEKKQSPEPGHPLT